MNLRFPIGLRVEQQGDGDSMSTGEVIWTDGPDEIVNDLIYNTLKRNAGNEDLQGLQQKRLMQA
jgi:hypothetical protein